ncbi:MAG: hypothetical protein AAF497_11340, partial [Planctomycetota bacterium]
SGSNSSVTKPAKSSGQFQLEVDPAKSVSSRGRTRSGAKKPPIGLWISLGLLTAIAIGLLAYVVTQQ